MGSCQSNNTTIARVQPPEEKARPPPNQNTQQNSAQNKQSKDESKQEIHTQTSQKPNEKETPTQAVATSQPPNTNTGQQENAGPQANGTKTPATTTAAQGNPLTEEQKNKFKADQMKQLDDLKRMCDEVEAKIRQAMAAKGVKPMPKTASNALRQAVAGDVDMVCPSATKIVRIFTSSTFTDTKNERNMLMKHAYPKVKEHCRKIGYEFQVVDMRWGVRDEATDDHMGTELCLKELKLCQEVSTGPNFISLLSHKYGYTAFPRVIEASEFEKIMEGMEDEENRDLFKRWYKKDENAVPSAYVLFPISKYLPGFISSDPDQKKSARDTWWKESEQMQNALDITVTKIFNKEMARKYIMSVTEAEVQEGLLKIENPSKHSLWFKRNIEDIEDQASSYLLSRFIECNGPEEKWKKARQMLHELKEERIAKKLTPDRIISYNVKWNQASGINPDDEKQHKEYLDNLCKDFVSSMTDMIDKAVEEKTAIKDDVAEYMQHIRFCQTKCKGFQGRKDTLELIKQYIQGDSREPLVLHGPSGTGKTSVMAMAAKMMKQWTANTPCLILRFIGTSPSSSSILPLLDYMCYQISLCYGVGFPKPVASLYGKSLQFKAALTRGTPQKPLIIMLDSLDQLDPAYDARKCAWLVTKLLPGTKIIVSTLPEPVYECFPVLKGLIKTESNFIDVPVLTNNDVKAILDGWLGSRDRSLTDQQMTIVLKAFTECPSPLFLKLSFEEAATWKSFSTLETTILQDTVRASIDFLFQKLEKVHGQKLVSRALGYLTLANNGATEAELEDILSCDDDVLNDVYMYWTPPMRRLPPLLLVRVRTDLSQYLVERGVDGVRVIYWYHRQFIEAANARYCSDKDTNRLIHERLADFFSGTWSGGKKKPYISAKAEKGEEDRHVSLQPLQFSDKNYNFRTLKNLPYHRTLAGQLDLLKEQCLANPEFLITKLRAVPFYSVVSDFNMAKEAFPEDKIISQILQSLNLSQKGLSSSANQLIPQMLQRIKETSDSSIFLQRCRDYPHTYMLPTKCLLEQPGGQLVHNISAHNGDIDTIDITVDGNLAVTACQAEHTVVIWNVEDAKKKRDVKGMGQCTNAVFCNNDQWIACEADKKIIIQEVETGRSVRSLPIVGAASDTTFCVFGKGKRYIMQFMKRMCVFTDLLEEEKDKKPQPFLHPDKLVFGAMSIPRGSDNYLAVCNDDQYFITVYDLTNRKFNASFRGFEKIPDEEDPGEFEEHEVEDMAILPDETQLAYTTMFTSEIVFADFYGNRLRSIPADSDRSYRSLSFTPSGLFMYLHDDSDLFIFNTQSLQEVGYLKQERGISKVVSNDMTIVLTVAEDGNLRIYDRSREEKTETAAANFTELYNMKFTLNLDNPRYVLIGGKLSKSSQSLGLEIFDVLKETVVRKCEMPELGNTGVKAFTTGDPDHVLLVIGRRQLVKIDINTMTQVHRYIGLTTDFALAQETQEILCTTRGGMHVKVYDRSGNVAAIIKTGQKEKINEVFINDSGTTGLASTDEGPLMVYEIAKRTHLYNIGQEKYGMIYADVVFINRSGTRLMFSSDGKIPGAPEIDGVGHLVLWDIKNGAEITQMYDAEFEKKYKAVKSSDYTTEVEQIHELDDDKVITGHYDYIMRVWNIDDGKLLQRISGHKTSLKIAVSSKCPYILSYGSDQEEDCLKIWDRKSYICKAEFSLDNTVNDVTWSQDGKFFITDKTLSPPDLAMWKVHNGLDHMTVNGKDYPETYATQKDFDPLIVKVFDRKDPSEEGDPDSDPEEESDDEEDDEEEDDEEDNKDDADDA